MATFTYTNSTGITISDSTTVGQSREVYGVSSPLRLGH